MLAVRRVIAALACLVLLTGLTRHLPAEEASGGTATSHRVDTTFNDRPFAYGLAPREVHPAYTIHDIRFPSPVQTAYAPNNTVPGEYYLPAGAGGDGLQRPAVVCLHILNGRFEVVRLLCSVLASRGVPAMMFKLPYYGERELPEGRSTLLKDTTLFAAALQQGVMDVRRAIDLLASRPEVDAGRIGIVGVSMGGILGAAAAGADPRVWRVAPILAGADILETIAHSREGRRLQAFMATLAPEDRVQVERGLRAADPLSFAEGLGRFKGTGRALLINAEHDEAIPRACTDKLAAMVGSADSIVWLPGMGHYTALAALPEILDQVGMFFAQDLPPGVAIAAEDQASDLPPLDVLAGGVGKLGHMMFRAPADGQCHFMDVHVDVTLRDAKQHQGALRWLRGAGGRFLLACSIPGIVDASIGMDDSPWMASAGKAVFRGTLNPDTAAAPLRYADPEPLMQLQVAAGVLTAAAMAPNVLAQWVDVSERPGHDGRRVLSVRPKRDVGGTIGLRLGADRKSPELLTFDIDGVAGKIAFNHWQTDTVAIDGLFAPPRGLPATGVEQEDVLRCFAAVFNFLSGRIQ